MTMKLCVHDRCESAFTVMRILSIDILAIIAGSVVIIISSVMEQAQEIADENSLTI